MPANMHFAQRFSRWLFCIAAAIAMWQIRTAHAESLQTLEFKGSPRTFLVHDYSNGKTTALVIVLHGGGGNAANAADQTQFDRVAKRENLIAVYPNGSGRREDKLLTWNAQHCCAYAMQNHIDDVGFISSLIDHMVAHFSVDASRVYVTGLSNGGMMTHRLGIALSNKLAAIAPVIGALYGDEPMPLAPVPVVIINGAVDATVPPGGGQIGMETSRPLLRRVLQNAADKAVLPAVAQASFWATANGCEDKQTGAVSGASVITYAKCRGDTEVVFYSVADNGHAWPGGKPGRSGAAKPVTTFDANEVIWSFFKQHTRRTLPGP